jgi:hypothetical protein
MHKIVKESMVVLLAVSMVLVPFKILAGEADTLLKDTPNIESMIIDTVFARPLGLVATVVGTAFFIVSLPFSALGGNTQTAYEKMVKDPARFTFKRPLGQFNKDSR